MSTSGRVLACIVVVSAVATAPASSKAHAVGLLLTVIGCLLLNRPPWRRLAKRALLALPLVLSLLLPMLLEQHWREALTKGGRAVVAIVCSLSFAGRLELHRLAASLMRLGVPRTFAEMLAATLRQLSAVREEGRRILLARQLRGAGGHWLNTDVLASLLASTARRGESMELALQLRGGRLASHTERFSRWDLPVLVVCALAGGLLHREALLRVF